MSISRSTRAGVVVIGRNEGGRLKRCLGSLVDRVERIVYVDSGSTDESVVFARSIGVDVVDLDLSRPFSMARGRNVGYHRLIELHPDLEFVQFVDGDCEVVPTWIDAAMDAIDSHPDVWVVFGRRRERFPDASIYNRLVDLEWDGPNGKVAACGGDALMRVEAMQVTGGFNESMIGGEEPELCVRIRQAGGAILRIDAEMTVHDAAINEFGQWWKRAKRGGFAYAHGAALHGAGPQRHKVRQLASALFWTAGMTIVLTVFMIGAWQIYAWLWWGVGLIAGLHVIWFWRQHRSYSRRLPTPLVRQAVRLAYLSKWAELSGVISFLLSHVRSTGPRLIEYKTSEATNSK